MLVEQPSSASSSGHVITFMVGSFDAKQTVRWTQGGTTELVLSAPGKPISLIALNPAPRRSVVSSLTAQLLLSHAIFDTVFVGAC
ncbi:MAG: hypothetical protein VX664_11025 [Chloroflexota bacterium]|nr:hypothetical protein [Chloroflexota bacterium]